MVVGQSREHTIFKHDLLNKLSGQFAGAASYLPHDKIVFIDATAGDGMDSEFSGRSSPGIFSKHLKYLVTERRCNALAYLIEVHQPTFLSLELAIDEIAAKLEFRHLNRHVVLTNSDFRSPHVTAKLALTDQSIAFLYIDPNNAGQVELPEAMRAKLPPRTTYLVTLGCNASGVKRAPDSAQRLKCVDNLKYLLSFVNPQYQDACLIRLDRDKAQWAYLLTVPKGWREKTEMQTIRPLKKHWPKGLKFDWHSDGRLLGIANELFLTKAEYSDSQQPELF
jgi:hypothetical protein